MKNMRMIAAVILIASLSLPIGSAFNITLAQEDQAPSSYETQLSRSELLTRASVKADSVNVGGARFELSRLFAMDNSHQLAVAWIEVANEKAVRLLYRSNRSVVGLFAMP